jgi:hypothetical protein
MLIVFCFVLFSRYIPPQSVSKRHDFATFSMHQDKPFQCWPLTLNLSRKRRQGVKRGE